jgi:hypothetical protein
MLERLQSSDFEPYLQHGFELHLHLAGDQPAIVRSLELIEVTQSRYLPPSDGVRKPFSLIFRDRAGGVLPQSTYALSHAALGTLEIFLVPIASASDGTRYQAVFN